MAADGPLLPNGFTAEQVQKTNDQFGSLFARFQDLGGWVQDPPLLAHYTSTAVLEKILIAEEVWFSNPLYMNDWEEMRFGFHEGARLVFDQRFLRDAGETEERAKVLERALGHYFSKFENEGSFDTYVFCLSEHGRDDYDGLLSMWRGYGSHGNGAALVFDVGKIAATPGSPLTLTRVTYASTEKRLDDLKSTRDDWVALLRTRHVPEDLLYIPAFALFTAILTHTLTTKHQGFAEEREWRVIYIAENDSANLLRHFLSYQVARQGIEPKFKFPIKPIPSVSGPDLSLDTLLERIVLGPSLSSPLARKSVERMLDSVGKPQFKGRLHASRIPLRPLER
jgi:hypothetical protein